MYLVVSARREDMVKDVGEEVLLGEIYEQEPS